MVIDREEFFLSIIFLYTVFQSIPLRKPSSKNPVKQKPPNSSENGGFVARRGVEPLTSGL
jgi:hypothetical protein